MSGSLIKIDEVTVTSTVANIILGGGSSGSSGLNASMDSTYDVYMLKVVNCKPDADGTGLAFRFTESGTPNSTANYDYALRNLRTATGFSDGVGLNQVRGLLTGGATGNGTNETANSIMYIFNANNSSEHTFTTIEGSIISSTGELRGGQGGNTFTSNSSVDGIQIFFESGNIESAISLTLYGLKK